MPGRQITDQQAKLYMTLRRTHPRQTAAAMAGFGVTTGARLDADPRWPSRKRQPRGRRRPDPLEPYFEGEIVPLLQTMPGLRPITILGEMQRRHPECFLGGSLVVALPRGRRPAGALSKRNGHVVDYHHVIHSLRRKPMALLNLTYRDQLFPREAFRCTWEALLAAVPARSACRTMVGLLALAHDRACEAELASELTTILDAGELPELTALQQRFMPETVAVPEITSTMPAALAYDALLEAPREWLCE